MISLAYHIDCMRYMSEFPDKWFELAIVDPPYGINVNKMSMGSGCGILKQKSTVKKLNNSRLKGSGKLKDRIINQMSCDWDLYPPTAAYFEELFRVSRNQIIWGGNYFNLPPTRCFVIWDKEQTFPNFSACEFAWTSFDMPAKLFRYTNRGFMCEDKSPKIHPTQKPVALYAWQLKNFAKTGDKILDTHLGSGSSRIAAYKLGFDFYGCEINRYFFDGQEKRFLSECKNTEIIGNKTITQQSLWL
jgi:site-specific DNA-methyltransferase (adenine-specific)